MVKIAVARSSRRVVVLVCSGVICFDVNHGRLCDPMIFHVWAIARLLAVRPRCREVKRSLSHIEAFLGVRPASAEVSTCSLNGVRCR